VKTPEPTTERTTPQTGESALRTNLAGTLAAAALLAACGGGGDSPPAAFFLTEQAPTRRILAAGPSTAAPAPTITELLDWAEQAYSEYFPGPASDQVLAPYVYRYYPATDNYVGVAGSDVYVLGPVSGGELLRVGSLGDFAALVFSTKFAFEDTAAARFLQQAQFSSTLLEIAAVRSQGYEAWLQAQFEAPRGERGTAWLRRQGHGALEDYNYDSGHGNQYMIWNQLLTGEDQLRRRCALALSEVFVVSVPLLTVPWTAFALAGYWDLLCEHAFGSFRSLLEAITLNPCMGSMLNTRGNEKEDVLTGRVPDENYAREVMQLFTIGLYELNPDGSRRLDGDGRPIETYGAEDVSQLARVFTGYDHDYGPATFQRPIPPFGPVPYPEYADRPMRFIAARHSMLPVNFLGTHIPANTPGPAALRMALDTLFRHPNVGPFFGRQMIQRLVTSHPSGAYVERVARAFDNNGQGTRGDLRAVWRAILLDPEARGANGLVSSSFGKLREPMVRFVQWARSFGIRSAYGTWKIGNTAHTPLVSLGQMPCYAPSVFNFFRPGYVPPSTAMAAAGLTVPEFQIVNESTTLSYINFLESSLQGIWTPAPDKPGPGRNASDGVDINVDYRAELALLLTDPPALMQKLNLVLCAGRLSQVQQERILSAITATYNLRELPTYPVEVQHRAIATAVLLVMITPDFLVQQ
jgi:uncharacterized protein (DUF1800 family)